MSRYFISWHPAEGAVTTRCFDSKEARENFRRMVDTPAARVQTWQEEKHESAGGITAFELSFN